MQQFVRRGLVGNVNVALFHPVIHYIPFAMMDEAKNVYGRYTYYNEKLLRFVAVQNES